MFTHNSYSLILRAAVQKRHDVTFITCTLS
jgi:hypothetical protein